MLYRTATICALILCCASFAAIAQVKSNIGQYGTGASQPNCSAGGCAANSPAVAPSLPRTPANGKWETEEFKASDASVSCAVVKFDSSMAMPILHLLCPGPDVFAPLRVHLTLTWRNEIEIPDVMRSMVVDTSSAVKFRSKTGDSQAEITFRDPQASDSRKEWITFTNVNVGLVVPPKQHQ
jgi:hypothetical protein